MYRKSINTLFDMQSRVISFLIITNALYVPTLCLPTAMVLVPEFSMSVNKSHVLAHFLSNILATLLELSLWVDS